MDCPSTYSLAKIFYKISFPVCILLSYLFSKDQLQIMIMLLQVFIVTL